MRSVCIAGTGMTRFGRFPATTVRALAEEAVAEALKDAHLAATDVGSVFFANAVGGLLQGQEMIRGQAALRFTGLLGLPIVNVENACASGSSAFHLAWTAIASGSADVALAVGAEKLTHEDKARTFTAIGTAVDLLDPEHQARAAPDRSPFMDIYAANTRAYMERSGAGPEDFARIAVKSHDHAVLNPKAQYQTAVTVEQVLESRVVASPLTLLMCSPTGDGAAALVLCSEHYARRHNLDATVCVRATTIVSGRDDAGPSAVERAARRAYEIAGAGPGDLDLVELHDAAAPAELITTEELGLCADGEGPKLLQSGATHLGGRVPVNPSGGLLSRGHPIGATGCAQLVELTDQLRHRAGARQVEGARLALAENAGGFLRTDPAAAVVTILERRA